MSNKRIRLTRGNEWNFVDVTTGKRVTLNNGYRVIEAIIRHQSRKKHAVIITMELTPNRRGKRRKSYLVEYPTTFLEFLEIVAELESGMFH